jgi:SAM-dependent methyltransferase
MEDIKETVRDRYAKIATSPSRKSCCGNGTVELLINKHYDAAEIADIQIADLGLGCGSPTSFSELKEGMTVLDLGSGAGIDVFLASKHVGAAGKVIGVDMTPQMIERAQQNAITLGIQNVEFRLGEIENMPVETGTADLVISNCVINLVPDKTKAFTEIYRVLKPGGKFIISDIVTSGTMPDEIRDNVELWSSCVAGALDKEQYLKIIAAAGFTDIQPITLTKDEKLSSKSFQLLSMTVKGRK